MGYAAELAEAELWLRRAVEQDQYGRPIVAADMHARGVAAARRAVNAAADDRLASLVAAAMSAPKPAAVSSGPPVRDGRRAALIASGRTPAGIGRGLGSPGYDEFGREAMARSRRVLRERGPVGLRG